jgi:N-acetylmuramoyl-L-alanine amidase
MAARAREDDERACPPDGGGFVVVLDPGHGGARAAGASSAVGVRGPRGTLEKDLTLALARLAGRALAARGVRAVLTREGDENVPLASRASAAVAARADALVSLHLNGSADATAAGAEVWVHESAGAPSRALAEALAGALGAGVPRAAALAVLDPAWAGADTAACLVEVAHLTNADEERRLAGEAGRRAAAHAVAEGVANFLEGAEGTRVMARQSRSEAFDIWHEVPLVPQLTGMSCWAAAAAMIVGWRDCIDVRPEEVARGAGAWAEYRDGLDPRDVEVLARTFALAVETPRTYSVSALRRMLERHGPLWVGAGPTGLHVIVVAGMYGDGTPEGTFVRVLDPWPIGRGERYAITFAELAASLEAASDAAGVRASLLHAGAAARGRRGGAFSMSRSVEATARLAVGASSSARALAAPPARYGTPLALFDLYRDRPPEPRLTGPPERQGGLPDGDERDWYPARAEELSELAPLVDVGEARTADDDVNPDLRHLGVAGLDESFAFSTAHVGRVAALNAFDVARADVVMFGLRGCRLVDARVEGKWCSSVMLSEDVPDHRSLRCVLGLWRPARGADAGALAVFTGSTVPNRRWMVAQRARGGGVAVANLLPTGLYDYRPGDHRFVPGVFVIQPRVVVRRTLDDLQYSVHDVFEEASPADNIHPAFTDGDATFSSAGCQTVAGAWTAKDGHTGSWARFRAAALELAGALDASKALPYVLLTGREARLAAGGAADEALARLRFGSSGAAVVALQRGLAARRFSVVNAAPGRLDAPTALALMRYQSYRDLGTADGVLRPHDARELGFDLAGLSVPTGRR